MKAKHYLRECLRTEPKDNIKGAVLNNLALAYYWQKFSTLDAEDRLSTFKKDSDDMIEREFQTGLTMLKDSIRCFEGKISLIT